MKNRFSWIVRGTVAAGIVAYATLGDPFLDAWVALQTAELNNHFQNNHVQIGTGNNDDSVASIEQEQSSSSGWKSRLVQQQGASRFGRESQNSTNRNHQRNSFSTLRAFKDSVGDKWKSTVQVLDKNRQVALGAIVSSDGWIVTKSSEVPDRTIEVRLYDSVTEKASVKFRRNDLDLALIKIDRKDLTSIQWNTSADVRVGGWLATTDVRNLPIAIGVMSVSSRNVRSEKAVLGVKLGYTLNGEHGALVENVIDGSGADRAGVQAGDLITSIDGESLKSFSEAIDRLKGFLAGQRVDVGILRDGKKVLITAQMMDLNNSLLDPTEMEVNGEISSRSTGFQNIMQHDSVISPHQCGGPIVDVYGNAVGLNIARAGRVSSYAIPARILVPAVAEMIASATGLKSPFDENVAQSPSKSPTVRASVELPASVPNGIAVESSKPEVILPSNVFRP